MKFGSLCVFCFMMSASAMNPAHQEDYPKEPVRQTITDHFRDFQTCYEKVLAKHPKLMGKIVFNWEILDDGTTRNIQVKSESSEIRDPQLESCMTTTLQNLKFPPAPPRIIVEVNYPFLFKQ